MNSLIIGFKTNKNFAFFSILALLLLAAAVFAPLLTSYQPTEADMKNAFLAPSAEHLFGTDKLGRDCFSRVLYGARNSLASALLLVVLVFSVGTALGVISGYIGGKTDAVIMRCADIFISFPGVLLAIAIAGIIGGSMLNAIIALTCATWPKYARLSRSLVLKVKQNEYIAAAFVNGGTPLHILTRHILPNILPLLVVTAAADIGALMLELAGLSFLGFGTQPPAPEWGAMISEGRQHIQTAPWLMIFPGLAIFVSVVIFNLWGDSLRDVLDPRDDQI